MCAVLNSPEKPLLQTFQDVAQLLDLISRCMELGKIVKEETTSSKGLGSAIWTRLAALTKVVKSGEEKKPGGSQLDECQQLVRDWKTLVDTRVDVLASKAVLIERDPEDLCPDRHKHGNSQPSFWRNNANLNVALWA